MADKALCSIPDCGKPSRRRGYCAAHHTRLLRYGDPTKLGRTRSERAETGKRRMFFEEAMRSETDACIEWPFSKAGIGYGQMTLAGKTGYTHRFACIRAHGPAPTLTHQAAHSCGNRICLNPRHLRWATVAENHADKNIHNTTNKGMRNGQSRLTEGDVQKIKALLVSGNKSESQIASTFGVARGTISSIRRKKTWGWLP